jgi:hypothetical protein
MLQLASSSFSNGDLDDLEEARRKFESSIQPHIHRNTESAGSYYMPPPQTASSRRRRLVEMELLESLQDSNEAIDYLMTLWMVERGAGPKERLQAMEHICSDGLVLEEATLRDMIHEYGMDWPEPMSRLAAILYFKGNSDESMVWANRVLTVKPWHLEAVQLQILNCLRLKNDASAEVWKFARQALPPLNSNTNNAARRRWSDRALLEARRSFDQAEAQLLEEQTFGTTTSSRDDIMRGQDEQHMWQ